MCATTPQENAQTHHVAWSICAHQRASGADNVFCSVAQVATAATKFATRAQEPKLVDPESKRQYLSVGRAANSDEPPLHIHPIGPASADPTDKKPMGSSHRDRPTIVRRFSIAREFYAGSVRSQAIGRAIALGLCSVLAAAARIIPGLRKEKKRVFNTECID
ncbi:MAG TPA: hypothetical protein VND19_26070 [Acetobacteraceae bacterium]|nr:hypothetical protein [Acetobacteraceae bacterium]